MKVLQYGPAKICERKACFPWQRPSASPASKVFSLSFFARLPSPPSGRGQMDGCCSLCSCWQRRRQTRGASPGESPRAACQGHSAVELPQTPCSVGGCFQKTRKRIRRTHTPQEDTVDRLETLIKTLKMSVHLSPYPRNARGCRTILFSHTKARCGDVAQCL